MFAVLIVFGALVRIVVATEPTCAVLFCNESTHSQAWIAGAQDEFIVLLQLVYGGFDVKTQHVPGRFDKLAILDSTACIERDQLPSARCYAKYCDFWRHRELFQKTFYDDDDDNGSGVGGCPAPDAVPHAEKHRDSRVCRTLQQWAAIGLDKLYSAYDAYDAGNYTNATSFACVAELVLRLVVDRLPPSFDDGASYRHVVFPAKLAAFNMLGIGNSSDTNDLIVGTRTVRSFRRDAGSSNSNHTLIATYIVARVLERSVDEADTERQLGGITELLWPVAGFLASFDKTGLSPKTICSINGVQSNLGSNDSAALLPNLDVHHDVGAVSDDFLRCSSFPGSRTRRYDNLLPSSCCSTIVLMTDIDDRATGKRVEPRRESLGYIAHYRSSLVFENTNASSVDPLIEKFLVARVAAPDLCNDVASVSSLDVPPPPSNSSTNSSSFNTTSFGDRVSLVSGNHWRPPREGLPITLPPGESRCIGGEKAGTVCSMQSECGKGRTCKAKPGTHPSASYCYDRFGWQESEPCVFEGELTECPYGYCYGAADGHDGGVYPLLYQYGQCFDPNNDSLEENTDDLDECSEEVLKWYEHPALDSIQ
jgi:hypothetical protein